MCCVCECYKCSGDGCDLASTLCKYDLRKGDLFLLNCARMRKVRRFLVVVLILLLNVMQVLSVGGGLEVLC